MDSPATMLACLIHWQDAALNHTHRPFVLYTDENDDGFLSFEDFLTSYAKERPVFLVMAILAAHTAAFWLVFNIPMDMVFKVSAMPGSGPVSWRGSTACVCLLCEGLCNDLESLWHVLPKPH